MIVFGVELEEDVVRDLRKCEVMRKVPRIFVALIFVVSKKKKTERKKGDGEDANEGGGRGRA